MAELTRVPAPRSPFDGWRGRAVVLVVAGILLAIAKPWGDDDRRPRPDVAIASDAPSSAPVTVVPIGQAYDPSVFGEVPPAPAWAIVTPSGTTAIDFVAPDPTADPDAPIAAGPVIELGTAAGSAAIAISHPRAVSIPTIRMWHFRDGGAPRRVELDRVASPWPGASHVQVIAQRRAGMAADRILAWDPGLYRLDLLIEPSDRVRSVMLSVAVDGVSGGAPAAGEPPRAGGSFKPSTLRLLPEAANLWAVGRYLSGWRRAATEIGCRVAEIWRATDPADGCWAVPLGRTDAVGVNLPTGTAVASIELRGIDPLPGPVAGIAHPAAPAG